MNIPREEIKSYVVITSMQWTYLVEHGLHTTEGLRIVRKQITAKLGAVMSFLDHSVLEFYNCVKVV